MTQSRLFSPIDLTADTLVELSDYVATAQRQFPGILETALGEPSPLPPLDAFDGDQALWAALRRYRAEHSIHALTQDLTGQADIEAVGQQLSVIARACLTLALAAAEQSVAVEHGDLLDQDGRPIRLAVVGLGKLGGDELNFNSDIDVVMTHQGEGQATGRRQLGANQYLTAVAQGLIQRMDSVTEHGRVWVMDTRLRPFGSAGALVWSLPAMETYFLSEGRTWERYAWLKASHAAGDDQTTEQLLDALRPFIYRRYLDYGIFESLRALHRKIDGQSQRQGGHDDIKRGPGGIRALEFLIQSQQLLEGGRSPELQVAGFLPALGALERSGQLDTATATRMRDAYGFLRTLENRLQAMTGQQTHHLPPPGAQLERLAYLMGMDNADMLLEQLDAQRTWVAETFHGQFIEHTHRPSPKISWPPTPDWAVEIRQRGLADDVERFIEPFETLMARLARRPLSGEGRIRLDRLMPELVDKLLAQPKPTRGLEDVLALIEQIAQRSAYLSLLYERPEITEQVIHVFQASEQIARWVIDSPQLLDDLIDPTHSLTMPPPPTLDGTDPEMGLNQLGRWRQTTFLKTALAELNRSITVTQASQQLTQIIETCIRPWVLRN
jgi:glutamate-ammonia-ligase adenylyltransferase